MSACRLTIFGLESPDGLGDQLADPACDGDQSGDELDQVNKAEKLLIWDAVM